MNEVTYVDFKRREVVNTETYPSVMVWQCALCQCAYSYTEGADNNIRRVAGGTEKSPVLVCEVCIKESSDILNSMEGEP